MVHIFRLLSRKNNSLLTEYFLNNPTIETYPQELEKKLKMSRQSMFKALEAVQAAGLIEVKEIGRTRQYRLRRNESTVKQLKILSTIDSIMHLMDKLKDSGAEIYLFGSAARGEDTEKSDIDLLIMSDKPKNEMLGKFAQTEKIRPLYFSFLEYSALARKDKPFYERIEKDKIRLI